MPLTALMWPLLLLLVQCAQCSPKTQLLAPSAARVLSQTSHSNVNSQLAVRKLLRGATESTTAAAVSSTPTAASEHTIDQTTAPAQRSTPTSLAAPSANSSTASLKVPAHPSTSTAPTAGHTAPMPSTPQAASSAAAAAPPPSTPAPTTLRAPAQQPRNAPPTKPKPTLAATTTANGSSSSLGTIITATTNSSSSSSSPLSAPGLTAPAGTTPTSSTSQVAGSSPAASTFKPPASRLVPGPAADASVASSISRLPYKPAEIGRQYEGCVWEGEASNVPRKHGAMVGGYQCCNGAWIKRGCGVAVQPNN